MTLLNAVLGRLADLLLAPLATLPALVVVVGAALTSAVVVLGVMRVASNQAALAVVKRRIHASLLEMRLYNDDVGALLRAQRAVLGHNLRYLGLSLVPLVVTAVPLSLAIAQLQAFYGYQGVAPGQPVEVTATLTGGATVTPLRLEGTGIEVVGPARYFPTLGETIWQVVPEAVGPATLRVVTANGVVLDKTLVVGPDIARRSPQRAQASLIGQLLYPSEPPLDPASGVTAITVPYPERSLRLAGWQVHWLWVYVAATFAFVLLLRRPLGVVI